MTLSTCNQKDFLIESKVDVLLLLRNFHMGGEVK